jgi:NAD dependent epimerase/dehydratase family
MRERAISGKSGSSSFGLPAPVLPGATGRAGFIGSHVVEYALKAGHTVAVLDNLSTGQRKNVPSNLPRAQGLPLSPSWRSRILHLRTSARARTVFTPKPSSQGPTPALPALKARSRSIQRQIGAMPMT